MPSDCQNLGGGGHRHIHSIETKSWGAIAPLAPPPDPAPLPAPAVQVLSLKAQRGEEEEEGGGRGVLTSLHLALCPVLCRVFTIASTSAHPTVWASRLSSNTLL